MCTENEQELQNEVVIDDNQLICALTNRVVKATEKEQTIQSMIAMLTDEYGFNLNDMERDFSVKYEDQAEGRNKSTRVSIAVFEQNQPHDVKNLIRFVQVVKDAKVKDTDAKNGVAAIVEPILLNTQCAFACWTNGEDLHYLHSFENEFHFMVCEDVTDFPAYGQTFEDLESQKDRAVPRKPANESLVKTFKRCHDYIYGNEGMAKTAFWELLNLIFCKLYDEKRRLSDTQRGVNYRRRFWVGVKEQNTEEGQHAVAERIKTLFEELKREGTFQDVFDGNEQINLSDAGLAKVAAELAKYSFLDASVDVKGTAYETIVSNTLKQERGQFFTPRNIIRCMVEMLDPDENTRVLDPACGSGGFLVMVLDHVRHKIVKRLYPDLDELHQEAKLNSREVNEEVRKYAANMIFGFDFDLDLKKAARMNMVMAGDGHANIFNINSLDYPHGDRPDVDKIAPAVQQSIELSADRSYQFATARDNAQGKFDMIFTNPPFGAKVEVDPAIIERAKYEIKSTAPEELFIEQCYRFLKPGGKLAIVLPDSILGNPNMEETRKWILQHFRLLASVDLPVEAFLPQVGVQASLLFLQKKEDISVDYTKENYDVFMAIVEKVGKDRRGVPIYERDDDGAELLFDHIKRNLIVDENGQERLTERRERIKHIDDDLPKVAEAYNKFKEERK